MKNQLKLILILLIFPLFCFAQKGKIFPVVEGETLTNKNISVPVSTKGKYTLVGVAYSKKSDDLLKGWYSPMYNTFVSPPTSSMFPQDDYDVHMYFVALMKGIYKVADKGITNKMKEGIDKRFHDNILVYQGKIKDYKKELNLGEKDVPYFFVLDKKGKIVYHTSGAYSDKKMFNIQSAIETE
jgi:hypothetical protein